MTGLLLLKLAVDEFLLPVGPPDVLHIASVDAVITLGPGLLGQL